MKQLILVLLTLVPGYAWSQDNTWEQPEEDETAIAKKKENPDAKYLKGAVPLVDGKVVFTTTIEAPGKTGPQIYAIIHQYLEKMTKEKNQMHSLIALEDSTHWEVAGTFEEWLVFKSSALSLDRTRFYYVLAAKCHDGLAELSLSRIHYLYDEQRSPQRYRAEEWITDKEAVNKKNTRLLPLSGKFRRKTVDRKNFLFNKIESLLK